MLARGAGLAPAQKRATAAGVPLNQAVPQV